MEKLVQLFALISLVIYWVLVAGVTLRVVFKRKAVGVSLAWLMVIYIIPVVGVICYLLFGELNLGRKRAERAKEMFGPYKEWFEQLHHCPSHKPEYLAEHMLPVHDLCSHRLSIPSLSGNTLSLQNSPNDILLSIIDDISNAKHSIQMEFYIWHPGGLADSVAASLIQAAKRGVKVKVLLDSAGSMRFFRSHWPEMFTTAGIEWVEALAVTPLRMFFRRLDLRQHRKIIIIDDNIAYTGSMNLVDPKHFKTDSGVGQWIDVMVRITGPNVAVLSSIHAWDWEVESGKRALPALPECSIEEHPHAHHAVQVIPSGPGMPEDIIQQVLILTINQAKESITITTPYFVPSDHLLHTLKMTAYRGVRVELIVPKVNDSIMVEWASRAFFNDLLEAGVIIHRFTGGLLHTKSVVIDKKNCLIGTVNLDMRSLWLNFEVTLSVDDPEFTTQLSWIQEDYIKQSEQVDWEQWKKRSVLDRFIERFFYMFSPLL